jgi:hypothetical protein
MILIRRAVIGLMLAIGLVADASVAWAREAAQTQPAEKSYGLAYVLVGFVVALGMMAVCRSGGRADKPRMVEQELKHRLEQMKTTPK